MDTRYDAGFVKKLCHVESRGKVWKNIYQQKEFMTV